MKKLQSSTHKDTKPYSASSSYGRKNFNKGSIDLQIYSKRKNSRNLCMLCCKKMVEFKYSVVRYVQFFASSKSFSFPLKFSPFLYLRQFGFKAGIGQCRTASSSSASNGTFLDRPFFHGTSILLYASLSESLLAACALAPSAQSHLPFHRSRRSILASFCQGVQCSIAIYQPSVNLTSGNSCWGYPACSPRLVG